MVPFRPFLFGSAPPGPECACRNTCRARYRLQARGWRSTAPMLRLISTGHCSLAPPPARAAGLHTRRVALRLCPPSPWASSPHVPEGARGCRPRSQAHQSAQSRYQPSGVTFPLPPASVSCACMWRALSLCHLSASLVTTAPARWRRGTRAGR